MNVKTKIAIGSRFGIIANALCVLLSGFILAGRFCDMMNGRGNGWDPDFRLIDSLFSCQLCLPFLLASTSFLLDLKKCMVKFALTTYLYLTILFVLLCNGVLVGYTWCNGFLVRPTWFDCVNLSLTICFCLPFLICIARKYIKSYFKYAMLTGTLGLLAVLSLGFIACQVDVICIIYGILSVASFLLVAVGYLGLYLNRESICKLIAEERAVA